MDKKSIASELLLVAKVLSGGVSDREKNILRSLVDSVDDDLASLERLIDDMKISKEKDSGEQAARQSSIKDLQVVMSFLEKGSKKLKSIFHLGYMAK